MLERLPYGKRPEIRVVGDASEESKAEQARIISSRFGEKHFSELPEAIRKELQYAERIKEPFEREAVKVANDLTNQFLEEFGLPVFDVSEENIHIVDAAVFKKYFDARSAAVTVENQQAIYLPEIDRANPMLEVSQIFHEVVHLKGHLELEVEQAPSGSSRTRLYRSGMIVYPTLRKIARERERGNKPSAAFYGLNEGIVADLQKIFFEKCVRENKYLEKDYTQHFSELANEKKKIIAQKKQTHVTEIMFFDDERHVVHEFPYALQRQFLNMIVDAIYEDGSFEDRDEVSNLFFKSIFTGRLLEIARLIESSFGKGSFAVVGAVGGLEGDVSSINQLRLHLEKQRRLMRAEKERQSKKK